MLKKILGFVFVVFVSLFTVRSASAEIPLRLKISRGQTLWGISKTNCGNPFRYPVIAQANGILNANRIFAGNFIVVPCSIVIEDAGRKRSFAPSIAAMPPANVMPILEAPAFESDVALSMPEPMFISVPASPLQLQPPAMATTIRHHHRFHGLKVVMRNVVSIGAPIAIAYVTGGTIPALLGTGRLGASFIHRHSSKKIEEGQAHLADLATRNEIKQLKLQNIELKKQMNHLRIALLLTEQKRE